MSSAAKRPPQYIQYDGNSRICHVQVFLLPAEEQVVAYCPALALSTYGTTEADARSAFTEALAIFIEDTQEKGTLANILLDLGWTLEKRPPPR